nr:hypothetical protein [Delftia acidovorans]
MQSLARAATPACRLTAATGGSAAQQIEKMSGSICNTVPAAILANSWSILNKHTIKNYPSGAHLPRIRPLSIFFWEMCIFSLPRPWAPLRRSVGNTNQWFAGSAVFWQGKLDIPLRPAI